MGNMGEHTEVHGVWGDTDVWEAFRCMGAYECMGHTNIWGCKNIGGHTDSPLVDKPMPASNVGKHPI